MDCATARDLLLDLRRERLAPGPAAEVRGHLSECEECRREDQAELLLDQALAERLPRRPAPPALRRRAAELLASAQAAGGERQRDPRSRPRSLLAPVAAAALALLSAGLLVERQSRQEGLSLDRLAGEVVSDHLRLLVSGHPHDVESSNTHEVKPWFEGRLDFAPVVPPDGGELRLLGGSVGYVLDRKAAQMSYAFRRHRVTLLAFPTAGLPWPATDRTEGGVPVRAVSQRGFNVMLWRAGEIGYALVSDVDAAGMEQLAATLAPSTLR
jgi:anti-sigma factor RsiW